MASQLTMLFLWSWGSYCRETSLTFSWVLPRPYGVKASLKKERITPHAFTTHRTLINTNIACLLPLHRVLCCGRAGVEAGAQGRVWLSSCPQRGSDPAGGARLAQIYQGVGRAPRAALDGSWWEESWWALAQPRQPPGACETPRALRELGNVAFQEEERQKPKESVLFGTMMSVWAHKKQEFLLAVYVNTEWSVKNMQGEKHEAALLLEEKEKETKGVGELNCTSLFPKRWGNKE